MAGVGLCAWEDGPRSSRAGEAGSAARPLGCRGLKLASLYPAALPGTRGLECPVHALPGPWPSQTSKGRYGMGAVQTVSGTRGAEDEVASAWDSVTGYLVEPQGAPQAVLVRHRLLPEPLGWRGTATEHTVWPGLQRRSSPTARAEEYS